MLKKPAFTIASIVAHLAVGLFVVIYFLNLLNIAQGSIPDAIMYFMAIETAIFFIVLFVQIVHYGMPWNR